METKLREILFYFIYFGAKHGPYRKLKIFIQLFIVINNFSDYQKQKKIVTR